MFFFFADSVSELYGQRLYLGSVQSNEIITGTLLHAMVEYCVRTCCNDDGADFERKAAKVRLSVSTCSQ